MAELWGLRYKLSITRVFGELCRCNTQRLYTTKHDLKKLRPMILKRIEKRSKEYPFQGMVPVAQQVLRARSLLIQGISTLLNVIPIMACKFCPEVFVGAEGHLICSCHGHNRRAKNRVHVWVQGGLNDILVPVESFHLQKQFLGIIRHNRRFDFDRVPAVVELCWQAGADPNDENLNFCNSEVKPICPSVQEPKSLSHGELQIVANETLKAWETLRSGVKRLLMVYPTKVCKYCSEVHVGPSGHKARLCGVFKFERWRGVHYWEKADVDHLVPPKIAWRRRPQDPPVLVNEGKDYYGRAPAVVDLCTKAGVLVPAKYHCMMKVQGLSGPVLSQ